MAGRIPQSFIDELIARTDIVELIGARVPLKKAGREYKACCPFHGEKTPSFWVSPDKQFYHCFGCGAHGTALGFVMQYDQLPFPEAVEELAGRLGIEVPHEGGTRAAPDDAARAQYDCLEQAAEHFAAALQADERARQYAARRGLTPDIIERFRIGYAPDSWNSLLTRVGGSAAMRQALLATGLIIERSGSGAGATGHYDRFRDRLMFPIRDARGRVIAFGGRVLETGEPKYLNSPETALFHKGQELYGLYEARQSRTPLRRLLIVEGYMDAVRLHQAGLPYAVATLGTATTAEHLRRAFRLVSALIFAFDGDRAGRGAAWRALNNALPEAREGRELRFLFLPEGEDPDSLVGSEGRDAFEARLEQALPLSEYLVAHLREEADVRHADGKARFIAAARPLLEKVPEGVYRELLLERIAAEVGLGGERLAQMLQTGQTAGAVVADRAAVTAHPGAASRAGTAAARFGRGSLVTQAIQLLLHYPSAATAVTAAQRATLQQLPQPGLPVLHELLDTQCVHPAASMAQILERWRERPEYRRLAQLAASESLVGDAAAAGRELAEAIGRLLEESQRGRLEALIARARTQPLDEKEKLELQSLIAQSGRDRSVDRGRT